MINRVSWVGTMTRTNTLAHTRLVTACDSQAGLDNSTRERGRRKSVRERERERERDVSLIKRQSLHCHLSSVSKQTLKLEAGDEDKFLVK